MVLDPDDRHIECTIRSLRSRYCNGENSRGMIVQPLCSWFCDWYSLGRAGEVGDRGHFSTHSNNERLCKELPA